MNACKYDFGVETSIHRPKYGLWLFRRFCFYVNIRSRFEHP